MQAAMDKLMAAVQRGDFKAAEEIVRVTKERVGGRAGLVMEDYLRKAMAATPKPAQRAPSSSAIQPGALQKKAPPKAQRPEDSEKLELLALQEEIRRMKEEEAAEDRRIREAEAQMKRLRDEEEEARKVKQLADELRRMKEEEEEEDRRIREAEAQMKRLKDAEEETRKKRLQREREELERRKAPSASTGPSPKGSREHLEAAADSGDRYAPLVALLSSIGLAKFGAVFMEEMIDLDEARHLTAADLERLGMPLGARNKLLRALSPNAASPPVSPYASPATSLSAPQSAAPSGPQSSSSSSGSVTSLGSPKPLLSAPVSPPATVSTALPTSLQALAPYAVPHSTLEFGARLGAGFFGEVYLVTHKSTGIQHAAKVAKVSEAEMDEETRNNFIEEIRTLSSMQCPYLVLFTGISVDPKDSSVVLLSEYMRGGGLNDWLYKKKHAFSAAIRLRLCEEIACGLSYLHDKGILHRDMKSDNVLLDQDGTHAKIADLGLAKMRHTSSVYVQSQVGTLMYQSPEQLRKQPYKTSADVYAFALVVYEIYALRRPYPMAWVSEKKTMRAQICDNGHRPDLTGLAMPTALVDLLKKCWAPEPRDRPPVSEAVLQIRAIQW